MLACFWLCVLRCVWRVLRRVWRARALWLLFARAPVLACFVLCFSLVRVFLLLCGMLACVFALAGFADRPCLGCFAFALCFFFCLCACSSAMPACPRVCTMRLIFARVLRRVFCALYLLADLIACAQFLLARGPVSRIFELWLRGRVCLPCACLPRVFLDYARLILLLLETPPWSFPYSVPPTIPHQAPR